MQPFPALSPVESSYPSPVHNYPPPPSPMDGYATTTTSYPQHAATQAPGTTMTGVPEPTNYYPAQAQQQQEQQQQPEEQKPEPKPKKMPARRKSRARKASAAPVTPQPEVVNNNNDNNNPANTPTPHPTTTTSPPNTKQCIPRLYYRFTDGAFYMQLRNEATGVESHHRMGRGTTAAETALGRFVAAARAAGFETYPAGFVFRLWRGVEGNLRDLREGVVGLGAVVVGGGGGG